MLNSLVEIVSEKSLLQNKWIIYLSKQLAWIIFAICMKVGHLGFEPFQSLLLISYNASECSDER